MMPRCRQCAFTMVEMLMVIAVVIVLVGLLLPTLKLVRAAAERSKSQAIVDIVAQGLSGAIGERQSLPLVQHPFAGTANLSPQIIYTRGALDPFRLLAKYRVYRDITPNNPVTVADMNSQVPADAWKAVATHSTVGVGRAFDAQTRIGVTTPVAGFPAIIGVEGKQIVETADSSAGWGRVWMDNDVCGDANLPIVYGAKRGLLMMLGAAYPNVHRHIQAPLRDSNTSTYNLYQQTLQAVRLGSAISSANYPQCVVDPSIAGVSSGNYSTARAQTDSNEAVQRALQSVWDRLSKLNGLEAASTSPFLYGGRVPPNADTASTWSPGFAKIDSGNWRTYTLPHTHPVDAWGNELFISVTDGGERLRVISAGVDGCLRINPGNAGTYETGVGGNFGRRVLACVEGETSPFKGFSGDDRDATIDNITQGVELDDYLDCMTSAEAAVFGLP